MGLEALFGCLDFVRVVLPLPLRLPRRLLQDANADLHAEALDGYSDLPTTNKDAIEQHLKAAASDAETAASVNVDLDSDALDGDPSLATTTKKDVVGPPLQVHTSDANTDILQAVSVGSRTDLRDKICYFELLTPFRILLLKACEVNYIDLESGRNLTLEKNQFFTQYVLINLDSQGAVSLALAPEAIQLLIQSNLPPQGFYMWCDAALCRGRPTFRLFLSRRRSAFTKVSKNLPLNLVRRVYIVQQSSIVTSQSGKIHHGIRPQKQAKAAVTIQAKWRCYRDYSYYKELKKASIICQHAWRNKTPTEVKKLHVAQRVTCTELALWSQNQWQEMNAMLAEKRTPAIKAISEAPFKMKGHSLLLENKRSDSLATEVERLKVLLQQEKKSSHVSTQACVELQEENAKLSSILEDANKKVAHLQDSMKRLIKKVAILEKENQALRKQVMSSSTPRENSALDLTLAKPDRRQQGNWKLQMSPRERKHDMLLGCISRDLGFSNGRPVAACIIFKFLLGHGLFEVENVSAFDNIIQFIGHVVETQGNNDLLCYWLSNTSMLLLLLQHALKEFGAADVSSTRRSRRSSSASLPVGKRNHLGSAHVEPPLRGDQGGPGNLHQVPKYPILQFKQQLASRLEKIYVRLRDNGKADIASLLGMCTQTPVSSRAHLGKGSHDGNTIACRAVVAQWKIIVNCLDKYLKAMISNCVPSVLVSKLFAQVFYFINVQLLNRLLLKREWCTFSKGQYLELGLAELQKWFSGQNNDYVGVAWDEMKQIRQAVSFLVLPEKPKKTLKEVTDLCTDLSMQQLYRISTMYWDENFHNCSLPTEVILKMKVDSCHDISLLEDDSSIPFAVDDISGSMGTVAVSDIENLPLIREDPGVLYLLENT